MFENKQESVTDKIYAYSSGLQKSIRRGLVEDSLFYANRMITEFPKNSNAVLKKLLTCLTEDIGFANPPLAFELYHFLKHENRKAWAIRNNAQLELVAKFALSTKSREIDNCICSCTLFDYQEDSAFIREYEKDHFKLNSESFKRSISSLNPELFNFLWLPASRVERSYLDSLYQEYNEEIESRLEEFGKNMPGEYSHIYSTLALETKNFGDGLILLYYTFFYLFSKYETELLPFFTEPEEPIKINIESYDYKKDRVIPDYVYDKHTSQWRRLWRGFIHFFTEGAKLTNKVLILNQKYENIIFSPEGKLKLLKIDKKGL
ncbi:MAG: hypothetical protein ACD_71C00179G0005 [uncultured bacterium (gcode 4)]|uniref:Uncharacterized protein n=1 Tax=uncultured bacterium (gcode 4) TaxID=1234023 RepID=K1YMW6_9BACT|nr:MAG: hypothetical protein ACD_71C00179G0005 [uncultured bacterium (gcode 4)]